MIGQSDKQGCTGVTWLRNRLFFRHTHRLTRRGSSGAAVDLASKGGLLGMMGRVKQVSLRRDHPGMKSVSWVCPCKSTIPKQQEKRAHRAAGETDQSSPWESLGDLGLIRKVRFFSHGGASLHYVFFLVPSRLCARLDPCSGDLPLARICCNGDCECECDCG